MYKSDKKIIAVIFFDSIIILRFCKTKVTKEIFGMLMLIISMLIETKNNSTYLTEYLDEGIRLLLSILPKMSWHIKTFKEKNNKLMPLCVDNDKLLEKYKTIWTKLEDLKKKKCGIECFTSLL